MSNYLRKYNNIFVMLQSNLPKKAKKSRNLLCCDFDIYANSYYSMSLKASFLPFV